MSADRPSCRHMSNRPESPRHEAASPCRRAGRTTWRPSPRPCRRGPDMFTRMIAPAPSSAQLQRTGHRVSGLDGRDDALRAAQQRERIHRLGVGDRPVLGAADVLEERVLGADTRIVQPAEIECDLDGLPVLVLQQIRERALERTGRTTGEGRCVTAGFDAVPAASKPTSRTPGSSMNAWKMPIALDPPPTHAVTASGSRPAWSWICTRASSRSPAESRGPSSEMDADPPRCRSSNTCCRRW